ncbi:MAG: phosphoribosyltransferase family protein, partial [Bacteroidota bacterium]
PEIAVELGKYYGRQLKDSPHYQSLDGIVPVPLHPRKQRMRGYNQSIEFAKGLSVSLGIPCYNRGLIRTTFTQTQTRKNRFERLDNVSEVFKLGHSQKLAGKHLLLVDDVLTTGATLEACGQVLLKLPAVKLSMLTLAIAVH